MRATLEQHWPEYLMEAAGLGLFMVSAGTFGTLLEYPGSPVHQAVADPTTRRVLMGMAMGLTAIAIIYSPWGRRSGAHINPAVTLTFWRLGKVRTRDAVWYVAAQFGGAVAGVLLVSTLLGRAFRDPPVLFVATLPGAGGLLPAWSAEFAISLFLMAAILGFTNNPRLARFTGITAGVLVASFITLVTPVSGMSINPARTFGSALPAHLWVGLWVYFTAPVLGMLAAAEAYRWARGAHAVRCAKLHHDHRQPCIFRCGYRTAEAENVVAARSSIPTSSTV